MKQLLALALFLTLGFSSWSQVELPDWLSPTESEHDVYVQGVVALKADSVQTRADVTIFCESLNKKYTLKTDSEGFYEFFLHENLKYTITYSKPGYINKTVEFLTTEVPEKSWKRGFAIVVDIFMDNRPEGFDDTITELPIGVCRYNPKSKKFDFDADYVRMRREALEAEIARCQGK